MVEKTMGRNDDDIDLAIDITEAFDHELSEEENQSPVKKAKGALLRGNILEAKEFARDAFQELLPEDIDIYCADNFYALKCFCLVRLFEKEFWDPFSLILSKEYWIPVIHGPYDLQGIKNLFKEIEELAFAYLKQDDYCLIAKGICIELLMSYGELSHVFSSQSVVSYVNKRTSAVEFHICNMYFRKGNPQVVCSIYRKRDRCNWIWDADNLYIWALALRELGKLDVALTKVEEALHIFQEEIRLVGFLLALG
ncbi:uncharacterized protein LOC134240439 [Saccostrea cucullata]|uniref:uncharacterized protein LOC134240439 n=1 Tax=Saccostrea cuccullata TaxID=36930 RepID=UPI002ED24F36